MTRLQRSNQMMGAAVGVYFPYDYASCKSSRSLSAVTLHSNYNARLNRFMCSLQNGFNSWLTGDTISTKRQRRSGMW